MNITDISDAQVEYVIRSFHSSKTTQSILFEMQRILIEKYRPIEVKHLPLFAQWTVDVKTKEGQAFLKVLIFRAFEEACEMIEAIDNREGRDKMLEELIDSWAFLMEASIFADHQIPSPLWGKCWDNPMGYDDDDYTIPMMNYMTSLGLVVNRLKNRAWSQSEFQVDETRFFQMLFQCFSNLIKVSRFFGLTEKDLLQIYTRKYIVNLHRIETKY